MDRVCRAGQSGWLAQKSISRSLLMSPSHLARWQCNSSYQCEGPQQAQHLTLGLEDAGHTFVHPRRQRSLSVGLLASVFLDTLLKDLTGLSVIVLESTFISG
jgi:hypothetical protein